MAPFSIVMFHNYAWDVDGLRYCVFRGITKLDEKKTLRGHTVIQKLPARYQKEHTIIPLE